MYNSVMKLGQTCDTREQLLKPPGGVVLKNVESVAWGKVLGLQIAVSVRCEAAPTCISIQFIDLSQIY